MRLLAALVHQAEGVGLPAAMSASLRPIAERILDDAVAAAEKSADTQRKALVEAGVDAALIRQHDATTAATLQSLQRERASAEGHALDWLARNGFAAE